MTKNLQPLKLDPQYRHYIWGGNRLKQDPQPVAEAWLIFAENRILGGQYDGKTLAQVTEELGPILLGEGKTGCFPLLIKVIDAAQWLSLQVHPNDEQACLLEGPQFSGKAEAWHVLDAPAGAELIAGFKPGVNQPQVMEAVRAENVLDLVQYHTVHTGDTISIPPGTIHAIGPDLLVYELQQSSDLTYRVYDWGRPKVNGRILHTEKSAAVLQVDAPYEIVNFDPEARAGRKNLIKCDTFLLDQLMLDNQKKRLSTHRKTFHAVTVAEGILDLTTGGETIQLHRFESVLIPAGCGSYDLSCTGTGKVLLAYLP